MKFLVSAGPTREKIDPVRFISNRSSGKMGYAVAEAAAAAGHHVTIVSGPVCIPAPENVELIKVESAAEMSRQMRRLAKFADVIVMAAAVADYRPARESVSRTKIKKKSDTLTITLERTEDILASLGRSKRKGQLLIGFAAETENLVRNAKKKLKAKNLDWIVANDVSRKDIGFDSDLNEAVMMSKDGRSISLSKSPKREIAEKIIRIATRTP